MPSNFPNSPEPEASEEVLSAIAQQVAQQSQTVALHIAQHDEIEAVAQERANAIIDGIRAELQEAHEAALARGTEALTASHNRELHRNLTNIAARFNETLQELSDRQAEILNDRLREVEQLRQQSSDRHGREVEELRAEILNSRDQAQEQRREMDQAYAKNLATVDSALRQERLEQQQQYHQLCSDTTAEVKRLVDVALEENRRETDRKLEETGAAGAQASRDTLDALAASGARWRKLAYIFVGATLTTAAIAISALAVALI